MVKRASEDDIPVAFEDKVFIPESPVVAQVKDAARRRGAEKAMPTEQELGTLKNNPWAEMLASPVRACQASGARLPANLMLDFRCVVNPADGKTYLVPAELANLDALEEEMAKQPYDEAWRWEGDNTNAAPEQRDAQQESTQSCDSSTTPPDAPDSIQELTTGTHPFRRRRPPRMSRIFSNINFLRLLTLYMSSPSRSHPDILEVKPGRPGFLLHMKAKEAIFTAQHYARNKLQADVATGELNAQAASKTKFPLELKDLRWVVDVDARLVQIMRKRVLVALKALAESARDMPVGGRRVKVVALPIPKNGGFKSEDLRRWIPAMPVAGSPTSKGETLAGTGAEVRSHPRSSSVTQEPDSASRGHQLGHALIPPGSIFLHIGDGEISSLLSSASSPPPPSTLPPLPQNPLNPAMLTVDSTYRFPIFSLSCLLNHDSQSDASISELNSLISEHGILQRPASTPPSSAEAGDYLILIRPGFRPLKAMIEEVWCLWRYLGGENVEMALRKDWMLLGEKSGNGKKGRDEDMDEGEGESAQWRGRRTS